MDINLTGKVIIVTGASSGIGKHLVMKLIQLGAKVAFTYHNNKEEANSIVSALSAYRSQVFCQKVDVKDEHEVMKFINNVFQQFGNIDILINNAGICKDSLLPIMSTNDWDDVINVNLRGVFLFSKYSSKKMIARGGGKIFNIASSRGISGSRGQTNYSSSKAGIIAFTKSLAMELGDYHILVNAVCPPFIETNLNKDLAIAIRKKERAIQSSALKIKGDFDVVNNFFLYACSDMFFDITGQVFQLDSRVN